VLVLVCSPSFLASSLAAQIGSVEIESGQFTWSKQSEKIALEDVTLRVRQLFVDKQFLWPCVADVRLRLASQVRPGALVAVIGNVGAGKSSLLSAILGEMHRVKGAFLLWCLRI
jgi:ABC-type multidrug transport system fused ATPase/permease subunit